MSLSGTIRSGPLCSALVPATVPVPMRNRKDQPTDTVAEMVGFNLRLSRTLLDRIDAVARSQHRTTSAQMRVALIDHVESHEEEAA